MFCHQKNKRVIAHAVKLHSTQYKTITMAYLVWYKYQAISQSRGISINYSNRDRPSNKLIVGKI